MAKKPRTYDDLYAGRFLKAGNLDGKKVTLTIKDADREKLEEEDGKKKAKAIISFEETELELVACKTNGLCLKGMFGPSLSGWIGKKVTLFPDTWNGEPCIRIFGSPHLTAPLPVQIKLPRRKTVTRTMQPTGRQRPDNGEVPADEEPGEEG